MTARERKRFVVSDLGFAFGVHDTEAPADYAHPAGRDKEHPSTNALNSRRLALAPTRSQAQAIADEHNARHEAEQRGKAG